MHHLSLTLSLSLLFNLSLYAQSSFPLSEDEPRWEYATWYFWGGYCEARVIVTGEEKEVCNDAYHEVWDCDENQTECYLIGYYRVEGERVYVRPSYPVAGGGDTVYCDVPEGLMYDFGTALKDTLSCMISGTFPAGFHDFWKTAEQTLTYEGIPRATLQMAYRPYLSFPDYVSEMNWIRGIGSDLHPFYSLTCIGDHCEWEQQTTTVYLGQTRIYLDTVLDFTFPCNKWITATHSPDKRNVSSATLYPNPSTGTVFLQSDSGRPVEVRIYGINGHQVFLRKGMLPGQRLNLGMLPPGVYLSEIITDYQRNTQKLVILR